MNRPCRSGRICNPPYLRILLSLLLLLPALACDLPIAKSQPTVSILSPSSGTQVAFGQTVEVQFHAEDAHAVAWVQMTVHDVVVDSQQVPVSGGQTPFDGILRWTPPNVGTYTLLLTAHNTSGQVSAPASLSITVLDASAGLLTPAPGPAVSQPGQPVQPPVVSPSVPPLPGPSPTTTATPTPTSPPPASPPTATPTPTMPPPAAPAADLAIRQILLHYDGKAAKGTFEVTICNFGQGTAGAFRLGIVANGVTRELDHTLPLEPGKCVGLFDPTADFGAYGITHPGNAIVRVTIQPGQAGDPPANNAFEQTVEIASVDTISDPSTLHLYQDCQRTQPHSECFQYLPLDPVSEPHEIKKQSGPFIAIAPRDYEILAAWYLADNQICAQRIKTYLGIPIPGPVTQRLIVSDRGGGFHGSGSGISTMGPETFFQELVGRLGAMWGQADVGVCSNAHEMTHLFVTNTPFPGWLNEGLATYMESSERTGYHRPFAIECRPSGWYGTDFEGVTREMPYQNLMIYDQNVPGIYYYTGSCFWDYLESTFGHAALQRVVQNLVSYRSEVFDGSCTPQMKSTYFIQDIVNPVVGTDISLITQERFGFGALYTGCE